MTRNGRERSWRALGFGVALALAPVASLAADTAPVPAKPEPPQIVSVELMITGPSFLDSFRHPAGLFVDAHRGIFLVADRGHQRVVLFDETGRCRGTVPFQSPSGVREPAEPMDVAADSTGRMFVVDTIDPRISVLTSRGSRLGLIERPYEAGEDTRPRSVDVGRSGRIYLLCSGPLSSVTVLDAGGRLVDGQGTAPGVEPFGEAVSVAVNEAAGLFAVVTPRADHQVAVYSLDGRRQASFGSHGEGEGTFSMAVHVTWGPGNTLWVTDTLRHSISVFDARGEFFGHVGGYGRGPGQFLFPVACGFLGDGRLVVLERGSARCQILEVSTSSLAQRSTEPNESSQMTTDSSFSNGGDSQ